MGLLYAQKNSRKEAKKKAFHVSEKTDLQGITEGICAINERIEKRSIEEDKNVLTEQIGEEK